MKKVIFANQKGGVGKTTMAASKMSLRGALPQKGDVAISDKCKNQRLNAKLYLMIAPEYPLRQD